MQAVPSGVAEGRRHHPAEVDPGVSGVGPAAPSQVWQEGEVQRDVLRCSDQASPHPHALRFPARYGNPLQSCPVR